MNLLVSRKKLLGNAGGFLWSYGGYLIVSALCDLCGVVLNPKNARNFIADCIESLHDTLKANLSMNGTNYSLSLNDELVSEFIDFYLNVRKYEMGNSYVKSLEEYKSKYENEPSKIILDSSMVNIKTKWKKEDTEIYIADGNIESLPSGVSLAYRQYLFKEGDQCTDLTGGYEAFGSSTINSNNLYIFYGGVKVKNIIDISEYTTLVLDIEYVNNFEDTYQGYSQFTNQNISSYQSIYYKIPTEAQKRGLVRVSLRSAIDNGNNYIYAPARGDDKMLNYKVYRIWLE